MKEDKLEDLFQNMNFDTEEPSEGHEAKFLQKLEQQKPSRGKLIHMNVWAPMAGVAAAVLVAFVIFKSVFVMSPEAGSLASVSPEMKETQSFYATVIKQEMEKLVSEKNPLTEAVVNDALKQLEILEKDHEQLKIDLVKSGNDKRVIYAIITNYQQRIELLQGVLQKIDEINNIKKENHENII